MSKHFVFHKDAVVQHPGEGTVRRIMAYSDQLMVCELEVAKGTPAGLHSHPHDQITYVVKGALEFSVDGEKAVVHAGDTIYMPGDVEHGLLRVLEDSVIIDTFSPKREDFLG
jgi:quercetin dioxygenase-like cupin family protein